MVQSAPRSPLLWGLYCACSWTWCIGLYLPVLLIDRFGWGGFIAFAVPNALGCAAMAFVVRTRPASEAIVAAHGRMMAAFSLVIVAYHLFFSVWLLDQLLPDFTLAWWAPLSVGVIVYLLGLVFAFLSDRDWLAIALVTYAISLTAMAAIGFAALDRIPAGSVAIERLPWLVPTIAFGFLLCPYLDLTFHRAVQRSARPRISFAIFGVAFALMLLLTVLLWFNGGIWGRRIAATLALGHLFAQMIFTVGVHLREVRLSRALPDDDRRALVLLLPALAIAALPVARLMIDPATAGEWTYLAFLGCYGLLFPAYVLVAMASRRPLRTPREWGLFATAVIACAPLYVQGVLFNRTWWLLPPLALFVVWGHLRRA
jgi:hypothetical protein